MTRWWPSIQVSVDRDRSGSSRPGQITRTAAQVAVETVGADRLPGGALGVFLVLAATVDVDVLAPSEDVLHAHSDQTAVLLGVVDPFGAAAGHVLDLAGRQLLRVRALGEVGGDQALQPTAPGTVFGGLDLQAAVTAQRAEQHWT